MAFIAACSAGLLVGPARASDVGDAVALRALPGAGGAALVPAAALLSPAPLGVYESELIRDPFDAVLLQGRCADPGIGFELAWKEPGGEWSSWRPAAVKRFPNGRCWAKLTLPGAVTGFLRLRATGSTRRDSFEIYAMDTFLAAAPRRAQPPRDERLGRLGLARRPPIHERPEWGARPPRHPPLPHIPERLTQHHTAGLYTEELEDSLEELRFIQDFHQNGRGWDDIGYHFLVDGAGRIFQGRPETVVGAHVKELNVGNIGAALLGNYHPPLGREPSPAQLRALESLGTWLRERYGVQPDVYFSHRDYNPLTECPGDRVHAVLGAIRDSFRRGADFTERVSTALGRAGSPPASRLEIRAFASD